MINMDFKKGARLYTLVLFLCSLVGLLVGVAILRSASFGFCEEASISCYNLKTIAGSSLFYGMGALAIVFAALLLVPTAFEAWKKFAMWFVPLAALVFIFYSDPGSGDLFSPYAEQVHRWVSMTYVAISLGVIAVSRVREKKI